MKICNSSPPENNLDDKQKKLEKEVERLKKKLEEQDKEKVTSCHQRSSGYESNHDY